MSTPTAKLIETHRNGAEVVKGESGYIKICELMEEFSLPKGQFPVSGLVEEVGFNRTTGFIWVLLKKKKEHKFKSIGKTVIYYPEITCFVQKGHLSQVTGVKAKELFASFVIADIIIEESSPDTIKFSTPIGLSRSHPISAFQLEDGEK